MATQNQMKITRRYVDSKRHTVGYFVGGQRRTVKEVAQLTRQGRIRNARIVGKHVQAAIGEQPFYALPQTIVR